MYHNPRTEDPRSGPDADEYFGSCAHGQHTFPACQDPYDDESHESSPDLLTAHQFQAGSVPDAFLPSDPFPHHEEDLPKLQSENSSHHCHVPEYISR